MSRQQGSKWEGDTSVSHRSTGAASSVAYASVEHEYAAMSDAIDGIDSNHKIYDIET